MADAVLIAHGLGLDKVNDSVNRVEIVLERQLVDERNATAAS